jgi:hypothetical protein
MSWCVRISAAGRWCARFCGRDLRHVLALFGGDDAALFRWRMLAARSNSIASPCEPATGAAEPDPAGSGVDLLVDLPPVDQPVFRELTRSDVGSRVRFQVSERIALRASRHRFQLFNIHHHGRPVPVSTTGFAFGRLASRSSASCVDYRASND